MTNLENLIRGGNDEEMTVAVYAREGAGAMGHSFLEKQVEMGCEFGEKLGYRVPKEYIFAEQASGRDPERSKLSSLLDLVESGRIEAVIVKDPSRLSRELSTFLMISKKLEEKSVRLLTVAG